MNSNQILQSDVLDIIFENKNKLYGAYELRKNYNRRLVKAIAAAFFIFLIFITFSFISKPEKQEIFFVTDGPTLGQPPVKTETKVEKKKTTEPKRERATQRTQGNPVIVKQRVQRDTIRDYKPDIDFGPQDIPAPAGGTPDIIDVTPPGDGPGDGGDVKPPVIDVPDPSIPIANPDKFPAYPGGDAALRKFLERHLTNPRDMEEGEEITVQVRFVVGQDGKLKSFEVVKDGGEEFNKEVVRVLKKMPEWEPGKSNGRDVAVYRTIPVKFIPQE